MIPVEEFYYGLQNGSIKLRTSSKNVKQLLRAQSLDYLTSLSLRRGQNSSTTQNYFPTEDLLTFTHLYRSQDSYGRPIENNHTIIVKVQDYLTAFPPPLSIVQHLFDKDEVTVNV